MAEYKKIKIIKGARGYGGPLTITPTEERHIVLYVTGGNKPPIVDTICELSGMKAVDGFATTVKDDKVALAIVNCGGVLRCGVYPQKKIPTVNVMNTGKSGPLARFINETIYVSGVRDSKQIEVVNDNE